MKRTMATMRSVALGTTALLAAIITLIPEDASAYWRGGWGGYRGGWGGYYRPLYAAPVYAPMMRIAPVAVGYPVGYGYATPYPAYGGSYGYGYGYGYGYYGYGRCRTDEGYGRRGSCDRSLDSLGPCPGPFPVTPSLLGSCERGSPFKSANSSANASTSS